MEIQAYKMLTEVYDLVTNDKHMLSTNEINYISGVLKTLLTLYADDLQAVAPAEMTEARRPPVKPHKKAFWGIFG